LSEKVFDQYNFAVTVPIEPSEERSPAGLMIVEPARNAAGRNEKTARPHDAAARKDRARRRRQDAEQEYRDEIYRRWLAAEAATNGYMLNTAGRRTGIDERTPLLTRRHEADVTGVA
jgi:hypothetical protein